MTALAGLWRLDGRPDAGRGVAAMLDAQAALAPHGRDLWEDGFISVGRGLFRLLPEDSHDRQPVATGPRVLVADLRIDNRDDLAATLGLAAAEARALADSTLLARAWDRWGEATLDRLVGDFALAVWDGDRRRLTLARDPVGARPLHFHRTPALFAFATLPKGLHALSEIPRAPDRVRLAESLALIPETGPRSFFADVSRVEPGQVLVVTPDRVAARRWWTPARPHGPVPPTGALVEAMREHLDRATAARLRGADGAVGAHLSAGFDSSAVATTAARFLARTGGRVAAFTAVPGPGFDPGGSPHLLDEGPLAGRTAAMHANMDHILTPPRTGGLLGDMDADIDRHDRPLLNPFNQPWWSAVNDAARERGLGVLLTGEMGNITLSYAGTEILPELATQGRWADLARETLAMTRRGASWRGALGAVVAPWLPSPLWAALLQIRTGHRPGLDRYSAINPLRARAIGIAARARAAGLDPTFRPRRNGFEARMWHLRWTDPGLFRKASLAGWGLDLRDPTGDRRLVEFCLSLPAEAFFGDGEARALPRRVLADRIPSAVLEERRKGRQAADWRITLAAARNELLAELDILERTPAAAEALDLARMRRILDAWSDSTLTAEAETCRQVLGRGIAVGRFVRRVSGP